MNRETGVLLTGIFIVALITMSTNSSIGDQQLATAIIRAQTMKIVHHAKPAEVQDEVQAQKIGSITANFGENTKDVDKNNVLSLQQFLSVHGFLNAKYMTGTFGPRTKQGIKDFQIANAITPANGFLGDQTRAKINSMIEAGN